VDLVYRLGAADQPELAANRLGDRIRESTHLAALQRVLDPPGNLPGAQLGFFALRIDGHDAARSITDEVDDGVRHLQPTAVHIGLAEQRDLQSFAQLPLAPRLVEEHDVQATRAIANLCLHHRPTIAHRALVGAANRDQHERFLSRDEIAHARLVRAINPSTGIHREQIEHRLDANLAQRCQLLLADTLQAIDRDVLEFAQRDAVSHGGSSRRWWGHSTPNRYG
jgi:hypothetical protein